MKQVLGIELGSTRIKAVLIDEKGNSLADGAFEWENRLENGIWTYDLADAVCGLQTAYAALKENYLAKHGKKPQIDGIGISAMMHGYLAFDKEDRLLVPFRTWRNTVTEQAAEILTRELNFNMPQRWSATHFYQAVLSHEAHVSDVAFFTTLSGYVHWQLTGERVLGVGDASGMFPIADGGYDAETVEKFNALLAKEGLLRNVAELMPRVLLAGEDAGRLTEEGARLLDPSGDLLAGIPLCPPEGDAGTGMVATNSVGAGTGNVSAGTSAFAMLVMERPLSRVYPEIDVVTTPSGNPVAMVHVNNFSNEINAWVNMFYEAIALGGGDVGRGELFEKLFLLSDKSDEKIGGLVGYNFLSGEPIADIKCGRPVFARLPEGEMNLANFMRMQIYSALGSLALGMEILAKEDVEVSAICGHGGFFKTAYIGASAMSAALGAPVTVLKNAGEGGAFGIALLALYGITKQGTLEEFLDGVFAATEKTTVCADERERARFACFMENYRRGLAVAKTASEVL